MLNDIIITRVTIVVAVTHFLGILIMTNIFLKIISILSTRWRPGFGCTLIPAVIDRKLVDDNDGSKGAATPDHQHGIMVYSS